MIDICAKRVKSYCFSVCFFGKVSSKKVVSHYNQKYLNHYHQKDLQHVAFVGNSIAAILDMDYKGITHMLKWLYSMQCET